MITEEEARYIAERKAHALNMPWGPDVTVKHLRLWPFAGTYRVMSRVPKEFSQSTIEVNARTGVAYPKRVIVHKRFGVGGSG